MTPPGTGLGFPCFAAQALDTQAMQHARLRA